MRTFVDVTQLIHWQGEVTGIPRVIQEFALRFEAEDTVYVAWVKEIKQFCAVDFGATIKIRGRGIVYLKKGDTKSSKIEYGGSLPQSGEQATNKKFLVKLAKKGLGGVRRIMPGLADSIEGNLKLAHMNDYTRIDFSQGDVLFIPWGEWWDENFIVKLEQLHKSGAKIVQILHDMSPIVVPQFTNSGNAVETFPRYCRRVFPIASLILSVSKNSKKDAEVWLRENKLKVPRIEVFRLGEDFKVTKPTPPHEPNFKKSGLKGNDFIMVVGTIEVKKNHLLLYYVYKLAKQRGIDLPKVVIVGRLGWLTEATYELMTNDPEVKDKFIFSLNTSDQELAWLFEKCMFTILPSFYEGWGIPIAESVAKGVPCLSSNTSSMVEIAEGIVEHFSPVSTDECLAAIQKWLVPANLKAAKARAAKYKPYSWDESFKTIDAFIKEIK